MDKKITLPPFTEASNITAEVFVNLGLEDFYVDSIYNIIEAVLLGLKDAEKVENSLFKPYDLLTRNDLFNFCVDTELINKLVRFLVENEGSVVAILKLTKAVNRLNSPYGGKIKKIIQDQVQEK